jgi:hypothetical protein
MRPDVLEPHSVTPAKDCRYYVVSNNITIGIRESILLRICLVNPRHTSGQDARANKLGELLVVHPQDVLAHVLRMLAEGGEGTLRLRGRL